MFARVDAMQCGRMVWLVMLLTVSFVGSAVVAEEKSPYRALGTPSKPKVDVAWNRYHDYAESSALIAELAQKYPEYCKLESLGKTVEDRDMWVLTVTDFSAGPIEERPAFWIDGAIHANEIQATEVVLYTGWYLAEMRGESEVIKRLLRERVFYLMPMMSPDSRDDHFYKANTTNSPRTGKRPIDDDRDGLVDEDPADDLDGDGQLADMRIKDPNGTHKPHPDFPHLMVPVKPGEKGEFRLLGIEGKDNDGDGEVNEDGVGYYDPNRDWGWNWQPKHIQRGAYRYPNSILENRMVAKFIASRPHIAGAQSYHNAGGMILRGPGAKQDAFDRADIQVYDQLAKRGEQLLPGYRYMNIANDLYEVWGGEVDWLHQTQGVFTFTNELFTPFNFFRAKEHQDFGYFGSDEIQNVFNKYLLLDDGLIPWHEVEHPQYGKVEVGGFKKNWIRQPPAFLLEEECHRNMAFTLYHADECPQVKIAEVQVKPLGEGLHEVTAIVRNDKVVPTHSTTDVQRKLTRPDVVSVKLAEGSKVVAGLVAEEPLFLAAKEQKKNPQEMKLERIGGHGVVYVRWIVSGAKPSEVEVKSVKGGRDVRKVE